MFTKWRMVMLGLVVSQGFSIVAMEKGAESTRRTPLSLSAELIKKTVALKIRAEEKPDMYYSSPCGGSPERCWGSKFNMVDYMKPWTPDFFPGQGHC